MPVWTGERSRCFWSYHTGILEDGEWGRFVSDLAVFLKHSLSPCVALTMTYKTAAPNALERTQLKSVLASEDAKKLVAHAFVTDSAVVRGVLTALDWVIAKPYEEKAFSVPKDALEWLTSKYPLLDADDVRGSYLAAIPPHAQW